MCRLLYECDGSGGGCGDDGHIAKDLATKECHYEGRKRRPYGSDLRPTRNIKQEEEEEEENSKC